LLLLLAVLLPVRGALAAAMLCPVAEAGMQAELHAQVVPAMHEDMDHAMAHSGHGEVHDHAAPSHHHDGHDHGAADKCNMCSAFCSLTPLVSGPPTLPEPPALSDVKFPHLSIPAPSFISDGQERPPRTI
jgi:hypothetical protein